MRERKRQYRVKRRYYKSNQVNFLIFTAVLCIVVAYILSWSVENRKAIICATKASVIQSYLWNRGIGDVKINGCDIKLSVPYRKIEKWNGKNNILTRKGVLSATIKSDGTVKGFTEESFNVYDDKGRRKIFGRGDTLEVKVIE